MGPNYLLRSAVLPAMMVLLLNTSQVAAELHVGTAGLPFTGQYWDFSDSVLTSPQNGDLGWLIVRASAASNGEQASFPEFWVTGYPAVIMFAPVDSTYEELSMAPSDTTLYSGGVDLFEGVSYVIRTRERHYAKLRVISRSFQGAVLIEYAYQDDGSRVLVNPTPIRATSWGRAKSAYKSR